jgi:hypothetical protein
VGLLVVVTLLVSLKFLSARRHEIIGWRGVVSPSRQSIKIELCTLGGSFSPMACEYCLDAWVEQKRSPQRTSPQTKKKKLEFQKTTCFVPFEEKL